MKISTMNISKLVLSIGAVLLSVPAFAGDYQRTIEQDRFTIRQQESVVRQQRESVEQQTRVLRQQERRLMELREKLRRDEQNLPRHNDFRHDRTQSFDGRPGHHG